MYRALVPYGVQYGCVDQFQRERPQRHARDQPAENGGQFYKCDQFSHAESDNDGGENAQNG